MRALLMAALLLGPAAVAAEGAGRLAEAEALLWSGQLDPAERSLQALLADEPGNVGAMLRLAQAWRWSGRTLAARALLQEAAALDPVRPDVREELAWTFLDHGMTAGARRALGQSQPGQALRARLERLEAPELTMLAVGFEDSHGVFRFSPRVGAQFKLPGDLRLLAVTGVSHTRGDGGRIDSAIGGAGATFSLGRAELAGGWAVHHGALTRTLHEGFAGVTLRVADPLRLGLRARRRPFLEQAAPWSLDEAAFHAAGAGGAIDPVALSRRGADELVFSGAAAPLRGLYAYSELRLFWTTDQNEGYAAAAGAGLDLGAAFGWKLPVTPVLRYDGFVTAFGQPRAAYFSPPFMDAHSAGVDLRLRLGERVRLLAEGGRTFPLWGEGDAGFLWGGGAELDFSRVSLRVRGQSRADPLFSSRRLYASLGTHF
jgi:hypothetical protein